MEKSYPDYLNQLRALTDKLGQEIPQTISGFGQLHRHGMADGAISAKEKELIALGIAIAIRCDGCIAYHADSALRAGATHQEITETIGVAIVMGGGPAAVYGVEALQALEQFEAMGVH
jgi:AhpD family alkylhydroperoxidase